MENQDLEIPAGFEHLFPGATQARGKKRSSILKQLDGNTDYGRDERKSLKRVSFAQHTIYQEVLPDGTINCIEKQLKAEGSEVDVKVATEVVVERQDVDMDCSLGDDTDVLSKSFIESDDMEVCSTESEVSEESNETYNTALSLMLTNPSLDGIKNDEDIYEDKENCFVEPKDVTSASGNTEASKNTSTETSKPFENERNTVNSTDTNNTAISMILTNPSVDNMKNDEEIYEDTDNCLLEPKDVTSASGNTEASKSTPRETSQPFESERNTANSTDTNNTAISMILTNPSVDNIKNDEEIYEDTDNCLLQPKDVTSASGNTEASKSTPRETSKPFESECDTANSTMFRSQSMNLNILSKIQLPNRQLQSTLQSEEKAISSKIPVGSFLSFLRPECERSSPKHIFCFQQKQFQRVSRLPKATINLRPSSNIASNVTIENIDRDIESDWETIDRSHVQQNEPTVSEVPSLRPRLRKSFGFSIQEKLQKKREEIENKRKTIAIVQSECGNFEQSKLSQSKTVDHNCVMDMSEEKIQQSEVNSPLEKKPFDHCINVSQKTKNVRNVNDLQASPQVTVTSDNLQGDENKIIDIELEDKSENFAEKESQTCCKRKYDSIENSEMDFSTTKHVKGIRESILKVTETEGGIEELEVSSQATTTKVDDNSITKSRLLSESSFIDFNEEDSNDDSLYDAFEKDSTFTASLNPLHYSFINKDDTLFLLAEELEHTFDEITLFSKPSVKSRKSSIEDKFPECCFSLQQLNSKWMSDHNVHLREADENKASIAFMNGLFVLELQFDESNSQVKNITSCKMSFHFDTELNGDGFFVLRDDFFFDLTSKHKGLLLPVNFMVGSLFEEIKSELLSKYPSTDLLDKLIVDVAKIVDRSEQLLMELRSQSAFHKFVFRKVDDNFEFVFLIRGLCRNLYLILSLNPKQYPFEVVTPKFCVHPSERHRYSLKSFTRALQEVPTGDKYIARLIKSAKTYVKATKKVEIENKKANAQKI